MASGGRDLLQEVDDLKAMMEVMNGENAEMKKMLAEALSRNKDNDVASHQGGNPHVNKAQYPSGYEPLSEEENNVCPWNEGVGWSTRGVRGSEYGYHEWEKTKLKEELEEKMHEQFRELRGPNPYSPIGIKELCLTPNIMFPKDFKMPELAKFDGSTNPIMHLKMYCTKMGMWSRDENFLINLFSESLDGAAWEWYMQLDQAQIKCWEDLALAFTNQYKFNLNVAPTRDQLKGMEKRNGETFKEYAQRWRALAARVIPPMLEPEMCSYFIKTLESPFFENMLGTHVKEFVDLIEVGERIEANSQDEKVELESVNLSEAQWKKEQSSKKKDQVVNSIHQPTFAPKYTSAYQYQHYHPPTPYSSHPYQMNNIPYTSPHIPSMPQVCQASPYNYQPINLSAPAPQMFARPTNPKPTGKTRLLPNFHMSKSELFRQLHEQHLIGPCHARPILPPYPRWYNSSSTCEYHSNAVGHSIEDCYGFREAVWKLLDDKVIEAQEETDPGTISNSASE